MKSGIALFLMLVGHFAYGSELLLSCNVGTKTTTRVEIFRDSEIGDTHVYYVRHGGETRAFFDNRSDSRGSGVHSSCVGKKQHVLITSGEFTANFLQGFVLVHNPITGKIERVAFAEKSPPEWVYLGSNETLVVFPTHGYGETNKKYVVYRHVVGATSDHEAAGTDRLPVAGGFEVIKLRR